MELEVLSPAGDRERLLSALNYGADAVYLGRKNFGMRASSGNFDYEGLMEAVKLAHEKGVKVYLTCNTLHGVFSLFLFLSGFSFTAFTFSM